MESSRPTTPGKPGTPGTAGLNVPSIFGGQPPSFMSRMAAPRFDNPAALDAASRGRARTTSLSTTASDNTTQGALSPDATDRVFPIRSVVQVDPSQQTSQPRYGDSYFSLNTDRKRSAGSPGPSSWGVDSQGSVPPTPSDPFAGSRKTSGGGIGGEAFHLGAQMGLHTQYTISGDSKSETASSIGAGSSNNRPLSRTSGANRQNELPENPLVTARFKHVVTEGGHAVITGRDGETLQRCEDEPIHIPGAVQSFGFIMALREDSEGRFVVRVVSENSKRIIGYTPRQLFELDSFTDLLSDDQADNLVDHIDFVKDDGSDVEANGPEVFTLTVRLPSRRSQRLWCAVHVSEKNPDLIICEFELEDDPLHPLTPSSDETPEPPEDTLNADPTDEEMRESTEIMSRPLRVLRSARKRRGEAAAMEVFNIMSQVQEQLAAAPNLEVFLKVLVGVVKELTGFHRVMVYQFDSSWNGKVVTELVDPRATKDLYKGLHFPASDIPKQARELYKVNKVRLLYDRSLETARLVCRTIDDLEHPLDMTHTYLRAMSPIHIKYLENMAVRSSMSISINAFDELWGLISCHAYGTKGTRVSFPIRKMCRLVGDSASRNIERLSYASRLQARKIINTSSTAKNPGGYIIASSDDLLSLFDANFGLLSIYDETKILGKLEAVQEALALLEYLRVKRFTSVMTSQDVRVDFPDLRYQPGFQTIAGLMLVPLSSSGQDFIVFFRKGLLQEVKWAGNPYEKYIKEGTEGYLEPRKSFKTWTETIVGKGREWTEEEIETAAVLCLVYGKFIEVWRQKEAALQNTQLTKLLLANSAHEVRTPLNAIINYLEIALEGSLDNETRDNLSKSHSASKSLIYVINDLLDLTKTEANDNLVHAEVFDIRSTYTEAVQAFAGDAKRKNIYFEVTQSPDLPAKVLGDQRRVRQAISNIVANAVQATSTGGVRIHIAIVSMVDERIEVEVVVEDTGTGMTSEQLDKLFADLEQAQTENEMSSTLGDAIAGGDQKAVDNKPSKKVLGLGLAVVARIVRNMQGQLRLKSEEGKGSRFVLQFPFDLPETQGSITMGDTSSDVTSFAATITESTHSNLAPAHEVMLVDRAAPRRHSGSFSPALVRRNSGNSDKGSMNSRNSARSYGSGSTGRSDADRLIEAMNELPGRMQSPGGDNQSLSTKVLRQHGLAETGRRSPSPTPRPRSLEPNRGQKVPPHQRVAPRPSHGHQPIQDSNIPVSAMKMPDELEQPGIAQTLPSNSGDHVKKQPDYPKLEGMKDPPAINADNMRVLIAEDDPINSRIIQKRLEKLQHRPYLTVNGEECASIYGEKPGHFDVILMDMQVSDDTFHER